MANAHSILPSSFTAAQVAAALNVAGLTGNTTAAQVRAAFEAGARIASTPMRAHQKLLRQSGGLTAQICADGNTIAVTHEDPRHPIHDGAWLKIGELVARIDRAGCVDEFRDGVWTHAINRERFARAVKRGGRR